MKRLLTFYVLLIGLLLSQDAIRLMVKNIIVSKNSTTAQFTLFENSEETEDQTEDQTKILEDAIAASHYHFETLYLFSTESSKNWSVQLSNLSILLNKITPPPQA